MLSAELAKEYEVSYNIKYLKQSECNCVCNHAYIVVRWQACAFVVVINSTHDTTIYFGYFVCWYCSSKPAGPRRYPWAEHEVHDNRVLFSSGCNNVLLHQLQSWVLGHRNLDGWLIIVHSNLDCTSSFVKWWQFAEVSADANVVRFSLNMSLAYRVPTQIWREPCP